MSVSFDIVLRPARVFGVEIMILPLTAILVCTTEILFRTKSTSDQRNPRTSPRRSPTNSDSRYNASKYSLTLFACSKN